MVTKVQADTRYKIYQLYLEGHDETTIAQKFGIAQQTVSFHIRKIRGSIDHRVNALAISEFQQEFIKIKDAINKDVSELSDKLAEAETVPDWLAIHNARHTRRLDLWKLMGDGELVLAVRSMKQTNAGTSNQTSEGN